MYKAAAFFDLDGTLFNAEKQVPAENKAALAQLKANNVLPVISTGRNLWEIKDMMDENGIDTAVAANGGFVWYQNQPLVEHPIGTAQLDRLVAMANADNLPIAFYNEKDVAISFSDAATQKNYPMVKQPEPRIEPDFYRQQDVYMLLLFTPMTDDLQAKYEAAFPELTFYRNGPYALDVVNSGVTKASGIEALMAQPDLAQAKSYGFGDGNNDIPMLEYVDYGVAMGNALPHVAAIADFQTTDNLSGGIVKGLQHYDLI